MPKKKVLSFGAEIKALEGDTGQFEGYGSVFGVEDSYSEIVDKGAFTESLRTKGMPALLWQHNSYAPIGIYTEMREDDHGLYVKGQLNLDVQQGREAYALLKQGALSGLSIGFMTNKDFYNSETRVRHLQQVRLMEVSLVTFPANEEAQVDRVKSAPDNIRDFESFLREAGEYSQEEAKIIAAHGYKGLQAHREGGDLNVAIVGMESLAQRIRKSLPSEQGTDRAA